MSKQYFVAEKNRFKLIEKVSSKEFNLIDTAPTLEAARTKLRKLDAMRDGCFFIQYPKSALKDEPGRVLKKKVPKQYYPVKRLTKGV